MLRKANKKLQSKKQKNKKPLVPISSSNQITTRSTRSFHQQLASKPKKNTLSPSFSIPNNNHQQKPQQSPFLFNSNLKFFSTESSPTTLKPVFQDASEQRQWEMKTLITDSLSPTHLDIRDTSGGCGAFYQITVVSSQFEGKMTLGRHRMVQTVLKDIIPQMHGLNLFTHTPKQWDEMTQPPATTTTSV